MKKLVYFFVLVSLGSFQLDAQEKYSLKSGQVTFGKGALTSGLDLNVDFSKDENVLFLKGNNDRAIINLGKKFDSEKFGDFKLIGSVAVFKNVPWVGPMFVYEYSGLSIINWNGWSLTKDKTCSKPGFSPYLFFSYHGVKYKYKKNSVGYSCLFFTDHKINHFLVYSRDFQINDKNKLFIETTYNYNENIPMFVIGYKINR